MLHARTNVHHKRPNIRHKEMKKKGQQSPKSLQTDTLNMVVWLAQEWVHLLSSLNSGGNAHIYVIIVILIRDYNLVTFTSCIMPIRLEPPPRGKACPQTLSSSGINTPAWRLYTKNFILVEVSKEEASLRENKIKQKCFGLAFFFIVICFPQSVQSSLDSSGIGN